MREIIKNCSKNIINFNNFVFDSKKIYALRQNNKYGLLIQDQNGYFSFSGLISPAYRGANWNGSGHKNAKDIISIFIDTGSSSNVYEFDTFQEFCKWYLSEREL